MPPINNTTNSSAVIPSDPTPPTTVVNKKITKAIDIRIVIGAIILALLLSGGIVYAVISSQNNKVTSIDTSNITPTTSNTVTTTTGIITSTTTPIPNEFTTSLVFQKFEISNNIATSSTTTLTDLQGNILRKYTATREDSRFNIYGGNSSGYLSFSSGAITSNQTSASMISILKADGTTISIPSSAFSNDQIFGINPFVLNNNNILMVKYSTDYKNQDYNEVNTSNGNVQTLFKAVIKSSHTSDPVMPQEISPDQSTVIFIVNDVIIDGKDISKPTIMIYNLKDKTITYKALPDSGDSSYDINHVSWDSNLALYTTYKVVNNVQKSTVHLYNFTTQKDIILSISGSLNGLGNTTSFSPDNKYGLALNSNSTGILYSTLDGTIIKSFDFGDPSYNFFQVIGWTSNSNFAYNIQKTTSMNNFNGTDTTTHSYDISSNTTKDYDPSLGAIEVVLVKIN